MGRRENIIELQPSCGSTRRRLFIWLGVSTVIVFLMGVEYLYSPGKMTSHWRVCRFCSWFMGRDEHTRRRQSLVSRGEQKVRCHRLYKCLFWIASPENGTFTLLTPPAHINLCYVCNPDIRIRLWNWYRVHSWLKLSKGLGEKMYESTKGESRRA